jgi:hypothetical protein
VYAFSVKGLGFRVSVWPEPKPRSVCVERGGFRFGVQGSGFRGAGLGFMVHGLGFRAYRLGFN